MRVGSRTLFGALLLLGAGCMRPAGHKTVSSEPVRAHDRVADQDFARIPVDRLSDVNAASAAVRAAHDGVLRAQQQATMAGQRAEVSKAEIAARKADVDVAKQKLELARSSGDRTKIADAELGLRRATAAATLEDAQADLASKRVDQEKLQVVRAQRDEDVATARLESAKLAALRASGDAAADQYDAVAFQARLDSATKARDEAESRVRDDSAIREAQSKVAKAQSDVDALEQQPVRGND